ncbi:Na(+)/H(+) antiporter subunit B [Salinisphaera sp.]|uniref:Na(+)/H(+) antiporter subunit B n=1 Tax=Salinisphaera sp. TaxID=1914330 RepID=UPI000C55AD2F|nr:Na(+)/H(+) antiporter subunit B [Salinisphaera sp.]MAS10034.1 cation:proton antiporter [Salinisphaera sp.]|tara:strand:+ start:1203 stop:1640 length:438 start_codon:yes stop_codon:yes gene_type:complete
MREHTVLRVITKLLIAPIIIFALYVQFHGDYSPGGGFQAGVVFAAAIILYALIFGLAEARRAVSPDVLRITAALGVLLFAGTGVYAMLEGGNFLDYDYLAHDAIHGQQYGLLLVEFGVGLTVVSTITSIFYVFAGRGRRTNEHET